MIVRRALALLPLALAVSCGYHLVGASSNLPQHITKLYVAPLVNQTGRAELDQRLAEEVTQEWVRRARFQLVSSAEEADAVLSGTITSAGISPVSFDPQGRANQYQLTVSSDVQLVDRTVEPAKVLWRDPRFYRTVSYEVDPSAINYFDREIEAIEQISREFARALVVTILEGF